MDLKQLHALKNYFQIHYTYYTWLASWSRVVARCPAMVLWPSNIFRTYKLSFTGRPVTGRPVTGRPVGPVTGRPVI